MDQYKNEYLSLINDDEDFAAIWQDTEEDFKEWCEVHNIKNITWVDPTTWHCQNCNTYIDDKKQEMEMHECKLIKVA
jgi:hypothetical protein